MHLISLLYFNFIVPFCSMSKWHNPPLQKHELAFHESVCVLVCVSVMMCACETKWSLCDFAMAPFRYVFNPAHLMLSGIVWFQGFVAYVVVEGRRLAVLLFLCNLREEQLIFPPVALYLCTDAPQFSCYTVSASVQCGPADLCQRYFSLALNKPSLSGDWETAKSGPSRSPLCLTVWTSLMPAMNHVLFFVLYRFVLFFSSMFTLFAPST